MGFALPSCPPSRASEWTALGRSASLTARYLTQNWTDARHAVCAAAGIRLPGELYASLALRQAQAHLLGLRVDSSEMFANEERQRPFRVCGLIGTSPWAAKNQAFKQEFLLRLGPFRMQALWNSMPTRIATVNCATRGPPCPALLSQAALKSRIPRIISSLPSTTRHSLCLPSL